MSDYILRKNEKKDDADLKELWKEAFGDSDELIECFFDRFVKPGSAIVAEADGKPVSAMYLLTGPTLLPYRKNTLSAGYCYGLATLKAYRGRGIGSAVYQALCELAFEKGFDAACVSPAESSLYPFYQKNGAKVIASVKESEYSREELKGITRSMCARVDITRYGGIRESLLSGEAHGVMDDDFYEFQEELSDCLGGGLFIMESGIAAADYDGSTCVIRELLVPRGDEKAAVASVAAFCPAEKYIVRTPAYWDGVGVVRPLMLASYKTEPTFFVPDDIWWGFAFD